MFRPDPTGATHEVSPEELLFSTTDQRGIIRAENQVFSRVARYPSDQLLGAPHSIVRHPDMPAGVFKLMWERLSQEQPFCGYVTNLAADGSAYIVFATATPHGDGYLSVRGRPGRQDLLETADQLYRQALAAEQAARKDGKSAREAAQVGAELIERLLGEAGWSSFEEYMWAALPAEVLARSSSAALPAKAAASGPFGGCLAAAVELRARLASWIAHLSKLQTGADALVAGITKMTTTVAVTQQAAAEFDELTADGFNPNLLSISVWTSMMSEISAMNETLRAHLTELRKACAKARFLISLAWLHNETLAQFASEAAAGNPGSCDPSQAITSLRATLAQDVATAASHLETTTKLAQRISSEAEQLSQLIEIPTALIDNWRCLATDTPDPRVSELIPRASEAVALGHAEAAELATMAAHCQELATPLDVNPVVSQLDAIAVHLSQAA